MGRKNSGSKTPKKSRLATLDLHGFKTDQVFDTVDRFISQAARSGKPRVRIIHGKGTGAVRKEVLKYLQLGGYPHQVETMENGEKNAGSLIIFLND